MTTQPLPLGDFDFKFPEELVASVPAEPRDSARLLVLDRARGTIRHQHFRDLPKFLRRGDCLVLNETKVMPCRLLGRKATGGRAELLLVREQEPGLWSALATGLKAGMRLSFPGGAAAQVESLNAEGEYLCRFDRTDLAGYLAEHGHAPLPPYILKRSACRMRPTGSAIRRSMPARPAPSPLRRPACISPRGCSMIFTTRGSAWPR